MRRIRSRPIAAALKELEKDPCLCCKYKPQGTCAYFLDGRKQEDACMDKLIYIKWMVRHAPDVAIRREAYDQGAREERERVLEVISDGKSALYEIKPDGNWDYILQAKMDVLCWIEESLRSSK